MKIEELITTKYKKLLLIPLALLIISLAILGVQYARNGQIIDKDVSLAGGISVTLILDDYNKESIQSTLQENFPDSDISIRELTNLGTGKQTGIIIDMTSATSAELIPILEENLNYSEISIQEIGSSLGDSFFKEMIGAIIFAFVLMAITILIIFRKLVPSAAVISSAILDIIVTLAIISLFGMKLSSAGIAAFLMVIGYSVDTDVLLATRLIKRKEAGSLNERLSKAFKTGITMTLTTLVALIVGLVISNSPIIKQMFGIIIIALVVDLISTWIMNASMLVWYIKKNEKTI
jgi:preprotein translocase subunit SecF